MYYGVFLLDAYSYNHDYPQLIVLNSLVIYLQKIFFLDRGPVTLGQGVLMLEALRQKLNMAKQLKNAQKLLYS